MKLAEALILRADLQKRLEQLKQRLMRSAKVQEGDEPAEDPELLIQEYERMASELETLIFRINRTNTETTISNGMTVTEALARRDALRLRATMYRELAQAAHVTSNRFSRSEVKFIRTVDVADIQREADDRSKELRELDTALQQANWMHDLIEE